MKSWLALAALVVGPASSIAATYAFSAPPYGVFNDFGGGCATPTCANFSAGMRAQGSFTTAANLPPNMAAVEATPLLTGYSVSDGLTTYSSADPQSRLYNIIISTDATGAITQFDMSLQRWQSAAPHGPGDRLDRLLVTAGGSYANHNFSCPLGPVVSPVNGVPDLCTSDTADASTSDASQNAAVLPAAVAAGAVAAVPSLSEWSTLLLALVLAASAAWRGPRRRPSILR